MAWMIAKREINWTRPGSVITFQALPSSEPQPGPKDFVDYCVAKGWAEEAESPNREEKRALTGRKRAE